MRMDGCAYAIYFVETNDFGERAKKASVAFGSLDDAMACAGVIATHYRKFRTCNGLTRDFNFRKDTGALFDGLMYHCSDGSVVRKEELDRSARVAAALATSGDAREVMEMFGEPELELRPAHERVLIFLTCCFHCGYLRDYRIKPTPSLKLELSPQL